MWSPQAHVSKRRFRAICCRVWGFAISFYNVLDTGVFMSRKNRRGKEKEWRKRAEEEKAGGKRTKGRRMGRRDKGIQEVRE